MHSDQQRFEAARDAVALLTNRTYAGAAEALWGLPAEVYQLVIDLQAEARAACDRILAEARQSRIPRATSGEAAEVAVATGDLPPVEQRHPSGTDTDVAANPSRRRR